MATSSSLTGLESKLEGLDINSNQHLRDLKLAIEYKYLRHHAPGGVFLSMLHFTTAKKKKKKSPHLISNCFLHLFLDYHSSGNG